MIHILWWWNLNQFLFFCLRMQFSGYYWLLTVYQKIHSSIDSSKIINLNAISEILKRRVDWRLFWIFALDVVWYACSWSWLCPYRSWLTYLIVFDCFLAFNIHYRNSSYPWICSKLIQKNSQTKFQKVNFCLPVNVQCLMFSTQLT